MFIGHFGVAFAAKRLAPKTSLGSLIFSAQFLDLLWPILVLKGIEHVQIAPGITRVSPFDFTDYPISHSLELALIWSVLVGFLYLLLRRSSRAAVVVGACVLSHWVLDFFSHRPDLPLTLHGQTRVGLGLWNSWPASIVVESLIFGVGIGLYLSATKPRDAIGRYGLIAFIVFLIVAWLGSLLGSTPPNSQVVAWSAMSMWTLVLWGWWADKHRRNAS